jgi:hypothetical protein
MGAMELVAPPKSRILNSHIYTFSPSCTIDNFTIYNFRKHGERRKLSSLHFAKIIGGLPAIMFAHYISHLSHVPKFSSRIVFGKAQ